MSGLTRNSPPFLFTTPYILGNLHSSYLFYNSSWNKSDICFWHCLVLVLLFMSMQNKTIFSFERSYANCLKSTTMLCICQNSSLSTLISQLVNHLPAMQETWVRFLGGEDPLEKEMATHSSILAWRIPWTEEPGRLLSMGSQESDTT